MKQLLFSKNDDESYEVRIYNTGDEYDWIRYGKLILNDKGNYELWTGSDFSSEGSGLENCSDEATEYTSGLDETFDTMSLELADILENF